MKYFQATVLLICILLSASSTLTAQQKVKISTKYGDMIAVLYDQTPKHRDNFIKLVKEGFYNQTLFHRVIKNFMIQGGDPASKNASADQQLGNGGPGYTIDAEINAELFHKKGALAAARLGDQINPKRESSGSQFYIVQGQVYPKTQLEGMQKQLKQNAQNNAFKAFLNNPENKSYLDRYIALSKAQDKEGIAGFIKEITPLTKPTKDATMSVAQIEAYSSLGGTPHLDNQYTVFGQIIEGLEVIDKIASVETKSGDRPVKDVAMTISLIK